MEKKNEKVAVIILNYNPKHYINVVKDSIKSVMNQDWNPIELLLVDNNSQDGSFEEIVKFVELRCENVKIIKNPRNYGFGIAHNKSLKYIANDVKYIMPLNPDAKLQADTIASLVRIMEKHPRVGIVQPLLVDWKGRSRETGIIMDELLNYHRISEEILSKYEIICSTYGSGGASLVRREIINLLGGKIFLDPLFLYYEDALLGLRTWSYGYRVVVAAGVQATHPAEHISSTEEVSLLKRYHAMKSFGYFVEITNSRYKFFIKTAVVRRFSLTHPSRFYLRSWLQGCLLAKKFRRYGVDIYSSPLIRKSPMSAVLNVIPQKKQSMYITLKEYNALLETKPVCGYSGRS
ncbi:MAG: glycosyltransferase family 2 protein [Nitrososphaerota archaeon]